MHCITNPRFFTEFGLFWRKASYVFPLLNQESLVFPSFDAIRCFSTCLALLHQKILGFLFARFFASDATFPTLFHSFGPNCTRNAWFLQIFLPHAWPYCAQNCWLFTGMFLFWCFHRIFPLLMQTSNMRIQTYHHGASRICRNLQIFWPRTFFVCKAIFTYSKIGPPEFIYVRLQFTYSESTTQNKHLCM